MYGKLIVYSVLCVILATVPVRAVAELVDVTNSVRLRGCGDMPAVDRPLRAQARLDEAARRLSRGEPLETATSVSGYRAKRSSSIHIKTAKGDDVIAQVLAQRFCRIVTDSRLRDFGAYRSGEGIWMVLAAPLALQNPDDGSNAAARVLELINEARSQARRCGRKKFPPATPLKQVAALESVALAHAEDMATQSYLGHKGSDGSMPAERATRAGYAWSAVAENVAAGQTTAEAVVDTWLASAGHCANLMSPRYSDTGVAYAVNPASENGVYWVQVFAARD